MVILARILSLLVAAWEVFKYVVNMYNKQKDKRQEEKKQRQEDAVDRLKNAKTEEEFDNAQSDIVNNKP